MTRRAPTRSQPQPRVHLADIKAAALSQIEVLAPRLLPQGRRVGSWWVALSPWRDDRRPSLHLSLTTTYYRDWGDAGVGGTILDLVMRLDGCDLATAAATLADLLGLQPSDQPRPKPPPEPPSCVTCAHRWARWQGERHAHCAVVLVPMVDEPVLCRVARRSGWGCGPMGRLHVTHASRDT